MNRFTQAFSRTGVDSLVRQFGDTITYLPAVGEARVIQAIIERSEIQFVNIGETPVQSITVRVKDHSVVGIASTEIDTGGDEIDLPLRIGEDPVTRSITRVISTDNGFVRFAVE
jgi:hypothetical protein